MTERERSATVDEPLFVVPGTDRMPAYICTDPARHVETEIAVLYGKDGTEKAQRIVAAVNAAPIASSATARGWCIRHADERRWRTMDTIGMPDWTEDPAKALCCRLREHVEAYAADDPDDVLIVEVPW